MSAGSAAETSVPSETCRSGCRIQDSRWPMAPNPLMVSSMANKPVWLGAHWLMLGVSSGNISSPRYLGRLQKLTQQVNSIDGVSAVKSLTEGPKSFQDALAGPFWNRLLIAGDRKSSNLIVFIESKADTEKLIKRIEQIVHELDEKDFRITSPVRPMSS